MKTTNTIAILACTLLFISCGEQQQNSSSTSPLENSSVLDTLFVDHAPATAIHISEAMKNPEIGKQITIAGEIMGKDEPISRHYAILTLGDPTVLTPCNRRPDDECQTPWDVCCDSPEDIKRAIATIQILDQNGKVLKQSLNGVNGLKELSYLTVTGTIAEGSNKDNLLINATSIHVANNSPYKDAKPVTAPPSFPHNHNGDHCKSSPSSEASCSKTHEEKTKHSSL